MAAELQSALNGVYALQQTILETDYAVSPPGKVNALTWTLNLGCTAAPCSGAITSAGGAVYQVSFDGRRITGMSNRREEVPCTDEQTGEKGGSATADRQDHDHG